MSLLTEPLVSRPDAKTVAVYSDVENFTTIDRTGVLDGGDVLRGFTLPLSQLFAQPRSASKNP